MFRWGLRLFSQTKHARIFRVMLGFALVRLVDNITFASQHLLSTMLESSL